VVAIVALIAPGTSGSAFVALIVTATSGCAFVALIATAISLCAFVELIATVTRECAFDHCAKGGKLFPGEEVVQEGPKFGSENSWFQVVVCARKMARKGIVGFRLWCVPEKWGEQEKWVSVLGVFQTKGENRNSEFQAVMCARQRERREVVGFRL